MNKPIPTIWRIDVEPDLFHTPRLRQPWHGFVAVSQLVDRLRVSLANRSGYTVHPTWFLRLDPHIEYCFGEVDFVVKRHSDIFDWLIAQNDPLGIHVHPYRWDSERGILFSEHADIGWARHCLNVAAESFRHCFGTPVRRACNGGYFLNETLVDAAVALGIETDVTSEPGLAPKENDPSFGSYATAPTPDFRTFPRLPFYPSRDQMGIPALSRAASRPILFVPLTAYDYEFALKPWLSRITAHLMRRPRQHLPLNPWKVWPSPKMYWDLVMRAVDEQPACYFAFAIRTDDPHSESYRNVRELLDFLPNHPIATRLRFVDPLGPEIRALAIPGM